MLASLNAPVHVAQNHRAIALDAQFGGFKNRP
jgi:hypothetical protein